MSPTSPPVIEFTEVGFRRDGVDILRNISWKIRRGEHWVVLGPNGSGKSTLLRLAGGYLWPMDGTIRRLGEQLVDMRELRKSIGWVSADLATQMPSTEPVINVVVSAKFAQLGIREGDGEQPTELEYAEAAELLRSVNCAHLSERSYGTLSQGERQQVLVARARMVDPLLIVLDEPCAGMDPGVRERFLDWLSGLASKGGPALVFVTHHVEEITAPFESTLALRGGEILALGATETVLTKELISDLYGVTVKSIHHEGERRWLVF